MIAYRAGEAELRAALAVALGEGRGWDDRGRWFRLDRAGARMVATDELIELFLREVSDCVGKYGARFPGFGRLAWKYTGGGEGRGALAGRWIPVRRRLLFVRPSWGWNLGDVGDE